MSEGDTRAVLTINLGALARNWIKLRDKVAPAECAAVVKADAYGIGIAHAVPALANAGCRTFFVAQVEEGVAVRAALPPEAIGTRVFVLNGLGGLKPSPEFASHTLIPVLGSPNDMSAWAEFGSKQTRALPAALHFNTGMNRLGFVEDLENSHFALFGIELVMSHFIAAEEPENPLNTAQITRFRRIVAKHPGVATSLANSSGIFLPSRPFYTLVRPGYALYGGNPAPGQPNPMEAVVALEAPILQTYWIETGETVGYNARWQAQRRSQLAVIGVGYADGFPLHAGHMLGQDGKARAIVAGISCPIVGRVSMDLMVIDITEIAMSPFPQNPTAQLLGPNIDLDELAQQCGTIGYTILTGLGKRYRRAYV